MPWSKAHGSTYMQPFSTVASTSGTQAVTTRVWSQCAIVYPIAKHHQARQTIYQRGAFRRAIQVKIPAVWDDSCHTPWFRLASYRNLGAKALRHARGAGPLDGCGTRKSQ